MTGNSLRPLTVRVPAARGNLDAPGELSFAAGADGVDGLSSTRGRYRTPLKEFEPLSAGALGRDRPLLGRASRLEVGLLGTLDEVGRDGAPVDGRGAS